jgi:uncharacterized protein YbjT (DUF2867 family)
VDALFSLAGYQGPADTLAHAGPTRVVLLSSSSAPSGKRANAVAAVALRGLATGDHEGPIYRLNGPEALTAAERATILGDALGRDLTVVVPSDEEAREGQPPEYADAFHEFYREGLIDETTVHPTVAEVLGRPPATFAAWVRANQEAFSR